VLLKFIKVGWSDTAYFLPESVHLSRDSSPEDLVKHRICHVIVRSTLLVFRDSKGMLHHQHKSE
jgi:hypothetical protein